MRKTNKLYYENFHLISTRAKVVKIHKDALELDQTVAYPEGGGQISDSGKIIHCAKNITLHFAHVKRIYGRDVEIGNSKIGDNKWVNVDGIILHCAREENIHLLEHFATGDEVSIEIDPVRREKLSTSHSASHLLYLGIEAIRPDMMPGVIGCHIREGQARFDFRTDARVQENELIRIKEIANQLVEQDLKISVYADDKHPDARYWKVKNHVIPCGGTHLTHTGKIGPLNVKRKNIGKGKERIICQLGELDYKTDQYIHQ